MEHRLAHASPDGILRKPGKENAFSPSLGKVGLVVLQPDFTFSMSVSQVANPGPRDGAQVLKIVQ